MKFKRVFHLLWIVGAQLSVFGQAKEISFSSPEWRFGNDKHRIETFKGKECLYMEPGFAVYNGLQFKNGIIEYDIAFAENRQFSSVVFRRENDTNYEEFYLRPHQSGNPDANQYTPVFNGLAAWQLYHGEGYGAPYDYKFDEWMHIKLIVLEEQMEVYIDDMEKPLIHVPKLKRTIRSGEVGFTTNNGPVRVANLKILASDEVKLKTPSVDLPKSDAGTVTAWQVSPIISPQTFLQMAKEPALDLTAWEWTEWPTEHTGTLNLAQVGARSKGKNAVVAKFTVRSDEDQISPFHIGYSDNVHVFCNGRLLFAGNNTYRTRDYRYLGTIGYFDTVYLPLKEGENEVWMLVTEQFGGWGLRGKFESLAGLTIKP